MLSDDRLAQRAAKGDERAFTAIFGRYHQGLYRYCLAIVGNPQDAQDALQNTMVKVLGALPGEERRIQLKPWLYRIAHNESIELLRRGRETRQLTPELEAAGSGLAEEAALRERLRRLISDLDELPERQSGALVMRELAGLDFAEIGTVLGTSAAVARQTLYEARLSLRQMDEGRNMSCEAVTKALSDGDGRVTRRRDLRAHLRTCVSCRAFHEEIKGRERDLAALSPLPAIAAAGLLQGLLGGGHGVAGGGLATALSGSAAQTLGASTALKGAATVAVVAAIGVGTADRGGLIDVGLPGGGGSQATQSEQSAGADSTGTQAAPSAPGAVNAMAGATAGRKEASQLGSSQAVKPGDGKGASGGAKTNAASAPTSHRKNSHSHGKGHGKQLPGASAHGQEKAASQKSSNHGSAEAVHPSKSAEPAQPSNPGAKRETSSSSPSNSTSETQGHGGTATQATEAEQTSPQYEPGETAKKP